MSVSWFPTRSGVTNEGNGTLRRISVTDPMSTTPTCPFDVLAPGRSMVCSATYSVTTSDLSLLELSNTANVFSVSASGATVRDDSNTVIVVRSTSTATTTTTTPRNTPSVANTGSNSSATTRLALVVSGLGFLLRAASRRRSTR